MIILLSPEPESANWRSKIVYALNYYSFYLLNPSSKASIGYAEPLR
jgi:hypothetical protein